MGITITSAPNEKLAESCGPSRRIRSFGIRACAFACPNAGECASFCYAKKGRYVFESVDSFRTRNLTLTLTEPKVFTDIMCGELAAYQYMEGGEGVELYFRIHDSGDFYDEAYLGTWFRIIRRFPGIRFYAYTKMVSMMEAHWDEKPDNLRIIYSYGGTEDHLIPGHRPHARVFGRNDPMDGYVDCSKDDLLVFGTDRVGLRIH